MREDRMLYKAGGTEEIHGGFYTTLIIDEAVKGELTAALKEGWSLTTDEAKAKLLEAEPKKAVKKPVVVSEEIAIGYIDPRVVKDIAIGYVDPRVVKD